MKLIFDMKLIIFITCLICMLIRIFNIISIRSRGYTVRTSFDNVLYYLYIISGIGICLFMIFINNQNILGGILLLLIIVTISLIRDQIK